MKVSKPPECDYDAALYEWLLRLSSQLNANSVVPGLINGLTLAYVDATSLVIAAGSCRNAAGGYLSNSSAFTKTTAAFSIGSGNGALDTGSVAASTSYHVHIIRNQSGGITDYLYSLSPTAPTMPSGFAQSRRIHSFRTNSSAQVIPGVWLGTRFWYTTPITDSTTAPNAAKTAYTVSTPSGVKVESYHAFLLQSGSGSLSVLNGYPDYDGGAVLIYQASAVDAWGSVTWKCVTNTSNQIALDYDTQTFATCNLVTFGWDDFQLYNGV